MKSTREKRPSPLNKLFVKQQPKVRASRKKAALLKTFAEHDYQRIATLIQKWLEEDQNNQGK